MNFKIFLASLLTAVLISSAALADWKIFYPAKASNGWVTTGVIGFNGSPADASAFCNTEARAADKNSRSVIWFSTRVWGNLEDTNGKPESYIRWSSTAVPQLLASVPMGGTAPGKIALSKDNEIIRTLDIKWSRISNVDLILQEINDNLISEFKKSDRIVLSFAGVSVHLDVKDNKIFENHEDCSKRFLDGMPK
jgi:hypothetical protein